MIYLRELDETTGVYDLNVADEQKSFVASVDVLLARAYIYRKCRSQAYTVFSDEEAVGMVLYYDNPGENAYELAELFIDVRFQRRGYATAVLNQVLNQMRLEGKYPKVTLVYVEGDEAARNLYLKFGFAEREQNQDEITMDRML